jgi:hypothetical protein
MNATASLKIFFSTVTSLNVYLFCPTN